MPALPACHESVPWDSFPTFSTLRSNASLRPPAVAPVSYEDHTLRGGGAVGAEERVDLAYGQGDALFGVLPGEHAGFGFGR